MSKTSPTHYFHKTTEAAPLAAFRIFFGLLMFVGILRFWAKGWIAHLYIEPRFFFSYYGLEFIRPLGVYTYGLFAICALSAIMITLGYRYRLAMTAFFLSFTYIELMDKTTYLNHYYFVSVLSFLMLFLPAGAYFSIDAYLRPEKCYQRIPLWCADSIKLLLSIVYFYAGLAKLNSDWLVQAQPLGIWLSTQSDFPLLGPWMNERWLHYVFSWGGALYDLSVPFLLFYSRTRVFAFVLVVLFHATTRVLFPIGMFPYIMIVSTLIFFSTDFHRKLLRYISSSLRMENNTFDNGRQWLPQTSLRYRLSLHTLFIFFVLQLCLPFRHLLYPGELFWTEEGYRFSWRVMLMEKAGYAGFQVVDALSDERFYVDNSDFLSPLQEKQMSTQPDFIVQYAQYLKKHFEQQGHQNLQIFVESYVALNGRPSRAYIDPNTDLAREEDSFRHKTWILPFNDEIKGL